MAQKRLNPFRRTSNADQSPEAGAEGSRLAPETMERLRRSWPVVKAGLAEGSKVRPVKPPSPGDFPFSYNLFQNCEIASDILERYTEGGFLDREFYERVFLCPECFSSAVWFRDVCENCGSADLTRTELVHHYPCATVLAREMFGPPDQMVCPKCRQPLIDLGVDYVFQPAEFFCGACAHRSPSALTGGRCSRCEREFLVPEAMETDWFSYVDKEQAAAGPPDIQSAPEAFYQALVGLVWLSEERDPSKGNHLERVSGYSRVLLEELAARGELREPARDEIMGAIEGAAMLHDVGQVGIPELVLAYPGRLREEHMSLVRRHVPIGDKWLHVVEQNPTIELQRAVHVVRGHHERWDGTGYPHGLKESNIPLEARIMAVADVYDAMTSGRAYRSGLPVEEAERRVEAQAGKHFDPGVIQAFFESKPKIAEVRESLRPDHQALDFEDE